MMPRPRQYEDAATKQTAYRMRKEKKRLALDLAILDLARAVRQARAHGPLQVALGHIPIDDHAGLIRKVAQAITQGTEQATTKRDPSPTPATP